MDSPLTFGEPQVFVGTDDLHEADAGSLDPESDTISWWVEVPVESVTINGLEVRFG